MNENIAQQETGTAVNRGSTTPLWLHLYALGTGGAIGAILGGLATNRKDWIAIGGAFVIGLISIIVPVWLTAKKRSATRTSGQ